MVSAENSQPVSGAVVELYSASNAMVASSSTDSQGEYQRKDIDAGNYTLKVSRGGFETAMMPLGIQARKSSSFNVSLRPNGSPVRSAIEEVGASWIKNLGSSKQESGAQKK